LTKLAKIYLYIPDRQPGDAGMALSFGETSNKLRHAEDLKFPYSFDEVADCLDRLAMWCRKVGKDEIRYRKLLNDQTRQNTH
jgi:hypothetical protein